MSQHKNDVPANQGRSDVEPLPGTSFSEFLVTLGTVASDGPAGMFGERLHARPQSLTEIRGPRTNVPTNPVEKFLKGLQRLLKKWGLGGAGPKQGLGKSVAPGTNVPTNPIEK